MNSTKPLRHVIGFTLIALVLLGCNGARSEPIEQAVDEFITPYVEDGHFSGSILIARGDDILVSKGYGEPRARCVEYTTDQIPHRLCY